jgi:hypothetical protein
MSKVLKFILLAGLLTPVLLKAQTFNDALRYSQTQALGTARFMGSGSAMGALGADFSVIGTNPAGLAGFRKSDLVISPGFWSVRTRSQIQGSKDPAFDESANRIGLSNVGVVVASNPPGGKWTTINFSFGLQRVADYQQEFSFDGRTEGSIVERFTALADGRALSELSDFEEGLAFDAGAIYGPGTNGLYNNDVQSTPGFTLQKSQFGTLRGRSNELSLALSGNYAEKAMLGFAIGIPFYQFNSDKSYQELDPMDLIPVFDRLEYREILRASGTGVNAKFGAILMPIPQLRVGLAVHTPTLLNITENFNNTIQYTYSLPTARTTTAESPQGRFEYRIITPWKALGSLGYIIPGFGFISAEAEYVDYSNASFAFKNASLEDRIYQRELNDDIKRRLGGALNIRTGIEYAYSIWRARAGLTWEGSPFRGDNQYNFGYSLGAGIRENAFFADIAFVRRGREELYSPYAIANAPRTDVFQQVRSSLLVLTIGFKI